MRLHTLSITTLLLLAPALGAQEGIPTDAEASKLVAEGRLEEAAAAFAQRKDADENDARAHFMWAYCLHGAGDLDTAHDAHIAAARFPEYTTLALYNHACVHALKGEKDAAFTALEEAMAAGFDNVDQLETDNDMDNLRGDGRFQAVILRLSGASDAELKTLPPARRFDFYLGDWSMRNGDVVERNLEVVSAFDGKGLSVTAREASDNSISAQSMFLYDEGKGLWRQIWMSKDGMVVVLEGGMEEGTMVLNQISQDGKRTSGSRSVFSNISSDGFQYEWQQSSDGGATWETLATRIFTRS